MIRAGVISDTISASQTDDGGLISFTRATLYGIQRQES
jgi:hypothetical protein